MFINVLSFRSNVPPGTFTNVKFEAITEMLRSYNEDFSFASKQGFRFFF